MGAGLLGLPIWSDVWGPFGIRRAATLAARSRRSCRRLTFRQRDAEESGDVGGLVVGLEEDVVTLEVGFGHAVGPPRGGHVRGTVEERLPIRCVPACPNGRPGGAPARARPINKTTPPCQELRPALLDGPPCPAALAALKYSHWRLNGQRLHRGARGRHTRAVWSRIARVAAFGLRVSA